MGSCLVGCVVVGRVRLLVVLEVGLVVDSVVGSVVVFLEVLSGASVVGSVGTVCVGSSSEVIVR